MATLVQSLSCQRNRTRPSTGKPGRPTHSIHPPNRDCRTKLSKALITDASKIEWRTAADLRIKFGVTLRTSTVREICESPRDVCLNNAQIPRRSPPSTFLENRSCWKEEKNSSTMISSFLPLEANPGNSRFPVPTLRTFSLSEASRIPSRLTQVTSLRLNSVFQ